MPEYLAPGVYVEETSFRSKTIEGVSTSTAGFVGAARFGPVEGEPELLTSLADFERIYGGLDQLDHEGTLYHNYLAHAARAFFEEGGKRLYVSRVASANSARATNTISTGGDMLTLRARHPGQAGNFLVTFLFRMGPNILGEEEGTPVLRGASTFDLVWATGVIPSPLGSNNNLFWLERFRDPTTDRYNYRLRQNDPTGSGLNAPVVTSLQPGTNEVRIITMDVTIGPMGEFISPQTWEGLTFHPQHSNSLSRVFESDPTRLVRRISLYVPLVIEEQLNNGVQIANVLLSQPSRRVSSLPLTLLNALVEGAEQDEEFPVNERSFQIQLGLGAGVDGTDGARPGAREFVGSEYRGTLGFDHPAQGAKNGLLAFEDIDDISIVAAPGSTFIGGDPTYIDQTNGIVRAVISHCERMRYRIGVLDAVNNQLVSDVRAFRGQLDSKYAALYYPWVCILDPVTETVIKLPPSGFVAGIYARNDVEHGVHKAPANEVVRMATGFEILLNKAQQDVLNPEGVNCFRFFEGRGYRLWGARTISSDQEWKYVNLRRYFAYLEHSIDRGTQFAVFENNSPPLWENIRQTVYDFLYNEWKNDRLLGDSPKTSFFVRCDRSTMTQNDLDNGRLICLVGVAPVRPAEFVIFRIGQWTADRRG